MIVFKNLPDTSRPINDESLNLIQTLQISKIKTTEPIEENTNYTIPLNYRVGDNSLEVYYQGTKLIKDEHYIEVGTEGETSNIIQFYNWGQSVPADRLLEFRVKGDYEQ